MGAMRATLGLDMTQFETRARAAGQVAGSMASGMSRSFDQVRQSVASQTRSFDELRASIDPTFAAQQRYAALQREVSGMVESGAVSQRAANLVLEQAAAKYMGIETAAQTAARAQREQSQAIDEATRGYQSLMSSINPVYAASKQYEAAVETVNNALRQGIVTQEEANRALDMAAKKYIAADAASDLFAVSAVQVGSGARNLGPAVQNAAFQIGDMATQITGGTSAMRAMAIQLPQLLGGLGMWGAVAGGAVAVLAALAPSLLTAGSASEEAKGKIEDLEGAVSRLSDVSQTTAADLEAYLGSAFGAVSGQVQALIEDLRAAEFSVISQKMRTEVEAATAEMTRLSGAYEIYWENFANPGQIDNGYLKEINKIIDASGMLYGESLKMDAALSAIYEAKDVDSFVAALASARTIAEDIGGPVGDKVAAALLQAAKDGGVLNRMLSDAAGEAMATTAATDAAADALRNAEAAARALAGAMASAAGFSTSLDDGVVVLEAKLNALKNQQDANNAGTIAGMRLRAQATRDAVLAEGGLNVVAQARYATDMAVIDQQEKLLEQIGAQTAANTAAGRAASSAGKASDRSAKALATEAERWRDVIDPMNKYRKQQAEIDKLLKTGALTKGEAQQALAAINQEIANADPLLQQYASAVNSAVDWMLDGFKGGFKGLIDIAKNALKSIISMFMQNRIMLNFGSMGAVGGVAGTAAAAAGVAPAGGMGGLGGILGGIGGIGSSFLSGASGLFTSLTGAGGGLAAAGTYLSSVLGGATASIGGFAAAAGALLGPIGLVAGAFSFFRTKTKLLDQGLLITLNGMDGLVETFKKVEKSRFFGLSKSRKTSTSPADSAVAGPILQAIGDIQAGIMAAAGLLGVGAQAFDGFAASIEFSTKGLSDSEIADKLAEKMGELGDSFAAMALSGMPQLIKSGEGAADALARLSTALSSANVWMDRLGKTAFATSLAGGGRASDFADVFGGAEAMNSAVSAYYGAFYSDGERLAQARKELQASLNVLGINTLPGSNKAFRALVDQAFGAGDNTLAAKLIALAPAMAEITAETEALTEALSSLYRQDLFATAADKIYASTSEGYRAAAVDTSDPETKALLAEVVKAIREGNINNARISTRLLALQERASLDPNGAAA